MGDRGPGLNQRTEREAPVFRRKSISFPPLWGLPRAPVDDGCVTWTSWRDPGPLQSSWSIMTGHPVLWDLHPWGQCAFQCPSWQMLPGVASGHSFLKCLLCLQLWHWPNGPARVSSGDLVQNAATKTAAFFLSLQSLSLASSCSHCERLPWPPLGGLGCCQASRLVSVTFF